MGRWARSSDALDFDSDGRDDLHIVNGMLTRRRARAGGGDLEGFFWRQSSDRRDARQARPRRCVACDESFLTARSPAGSATSSCTTMDTAVTTRSGTAGLDLDQDGRSFAVLDVDGDGDPDLR